MPFARKLVISCWLLVISFLILFILPSSANAQVANLNASCPANTPSLRADWNIGEGSDCNIWVQAGSEAYQVSTSCSDDNFATSSTLRDNRGVANPPQITMKSGDVYQLFASDGTSTNQSNPVTVTCQAPVVPVTPPAPNDTTTPSMQGSNTIPANLKDYQAPQHANFSLQTVMHGILCETAGMSAYGKCTGMQRQQNGELKLVLFNKNPGGGAMGSLGSVIGTMYDHPPTSTYEYLADFGSDMGIISPAYAQVPGSGSSIITPVRELWRVVRNFSYVLFILIFIIVGFMIMFRQRLNPQTVISIQTALPSLIIGLILVTFSYFISALIVDVSFVGMQLVAQIFISNGLPNALGDQAQIQELARDSNAFQLFTSSFRFPENVMDVTGGASRTIGSVFGGAWIGSIVTAIIGALIGFLIFPPLGLAAIAGGAVVGGGIPVVIGLLVPLILVLALIVQFFRLLLSLINAYIAILIATVASPLVILMGSLPGRGKNLSMWWRTLLGNALVFPAVFAAFLFAGMILETPPQSWEASPPLFGGLSTELLRFIIAYGILLGTPAIPDMVKNALGVKDIRGIPQAALGGFNVGQNVTARVGQGVGRFGGRALYERFEGTATGLPSTGGPAANSLRGRTVTALYRRFGNQNWLTGRRR